MKKLTSLGVAAFTALMAVLAIVAAQTPAQAYPEVQIGLEASRVVLYSGQSFTATATSNVHCSWRLEWNSKVHTGNSSAGADLTASYTAPRVTESTKIPLHGTCAYDSAETPTARSAATWRRTIQITVLPRGTAVSPPGGSDLPNTGGPDWMVLAGGLVLLLTGATAVTIARRRAEEAELQASKA